MAIDMTTVKQIMHNNKEVAKIEDSLGNILWQKQSPTPTTYKYYYIANNGVTAIDFANKTKTTYTKSGGVTPNMANGSVGYYNGHLYCANQGTSTWEITLDDTNHTYTFTLVDNFPTYMNWAYRMPNGNCYYVTANTPNATYQLGTNTTADVGANAFGGNAFTDGTDYYTYLQQSQTASIYKLVNGQWVTQSDITQPGLYGYNIWYLDGHIYIDQGTTHKEWDFTNKAWINKTWYGNTNFNGGRVFADKDGNVYQVGNTGTNRYIWKLDKATSTWSQYWDWGTAIRGDNMCCQYGGLQLSQIMRPGKEL